MSEARPKKRRNRKATETAILEAFSRVVEQKGLAAANPTSVMVEAGYSKPLLYDYFGDMGGLVEAWFERNKIWPDYDFPDEIEGTEELKQCLKKFLMTIANTLRNNPCAQEFRSAELSKNWEYQAILDASREKWLQENMSAVMSHPEIRDADNWNLLFIIYNSINYLVLRARAATPHVGLHLEDDKDWADAMVSVESVIDDLILLSRLRRVMRDEPVL